MPLLSRKKREKSSEKRESEPRRRSREHESSEEAIFQYSISEERTAAFSAEIICVSFFLFGGRLFNINVSDDI